MTLTDTQLVLLSAAAQHEDYLISLPATLKGRAAQNALTPLIRRGLVRERPISAQQPLWRMDEGGQLIGLYITAAGLAALGLDTPEQADDNAAPDNRPAAAPQHQVAPRAGTKQDLLLQLLSREQGATITDLMAATGWLPHTTRAALTGLRKRGYHLTRTSSAAGFAYQIDITAKAVC